MILLLCIKQNITNISNYILGAYVPLTSDGNIFVDGVLASCYASSDHDLTHLAMAPIQWFPDMIQLMSGYKTYVNILKDLRHWLLPSVLTYWKF